MAKAWSAFHPDVLPELPMAPLVMVNHYLRNAAIEFCESTKALVANLTAMDAVADQMAYALSLASNTELVDIVGVWFSGEKLVPKSPVFLATKYDDWTTETGTPEFYTQQDTGNVLLVPAPATAETGAIKIKVATKPGTAATGIDDWLFSQFRLAIAAGAKAKMMVLAGKPWTNDTKALVYMVQFNAAIDNATPRVADGFVRARPRFAGSFC